MNKRKNLNEIVDEILRESETRKQYAPYVYSGKAEQIADAQKQQFKVPNKRMRKRHRKIIEINDVVDLLLLDERVKSYVKQCIERKPHLVSKARVELMTILQLKAALKKQKTS